MTLRSKLWVFARMNFLRSEQTLLAFKALIPTEALRKLNVELVVANLRQALFRPGRQWQQGHPGCAS